jgi:energy-coupling factor transporter transmembrane protein EcfT
MALMFLIALRFISSLQVEGQRIREAQLARSYNPGKGHREKVRSVKLLLEPLVVNTDPGTRPYNGHERLQEQVQCGE